MRVAAQLANDWIWDCLMAESVMTTHWFTDSVFFGHQPGIAPTKLTVSLWHCVPMISNASDILRYNEEFIN